jgi:PhnB protein
MEANMQVQSYLFFNGRCQEAADFYATAIGAKVEMMMRYSDAPSPPPKGSLPEGWGDKVLHMALRIGETQVLASDGNSPTPEFSGFRLSLAVADAAAAKKAFAALADGGSVQAPLSSTFFAESFGMLTDKFGVGWMVLSPPKS